MGLAPILDPSRIEARGGNASANGRCQPTSGRRPRRLAGWRNQPAWRSPLAGARSGGWLRPADSHRPVASARQTSPPCRTGSELRRSAPATVSPQRRIPVRRSRRASLLGSDWEIPSQTTEPQAYVVRDPSLAGRHHVASRAAPRSCVRPTHTLGSSRGVPKVHGRAQSCADGGVVLAVDAQASRLRTALERSRQEPDKHNRQTQIVDCISVLRVAHIHHNTNQYDSESDVQHRESRFSGQFHEYCRKEESWPGW